MKKIMNWSICGATNMGLVEIDRMLKLIYLQMVKDVLNDKPLPTAEEIALKTCERIHEEWE